MNLVAMLTFPARAVLAFGEASLGVIRLIAPDGPVRLLYHATEITSEHHPIAAANWAGLAVRQFLKL